eukprot:7838479-Lingulodinium_polyedra.AAC.1
MGEHRLCRATLHCADPHVLHQVAAGLEEQAGRGEHLCGYDLVVIPLNQGQVVDAVIEHLAIANDEPAGALLDRLLLHLPAEIGHKSSFPKDQ